MGLEQIERDILDIEAHIKKRKKIYNIKDARLFFL
jgi:hypothetical protein